MNLHCRIRNFLWNAEWYARRRPWRGVWQFLRRLLLCWHQTQCPCRYIDWNNCPCVCGMEVLRCR